MYLIEHPFQPHRSRALILSSTADPVQIVQFIQCLRDRRYVTTPFFDREDLPVGADVLMAIQQSFEPSTTRPLHREDRKESNRRARAFFPTKQKNKLLTRTKRCEPR
jgi:hypothetical protein